jgi:quercetin dioxygenase-like cupin family protein
MPNRAPRRSTVFRGEDVEHQSDHPSEPGQGVHVAELLGPRQGAQHLAVAIVTLDSGAAVQGHLHPFEESFFVLDGAPLVAIADKQYALAPQDFGLIPTATGHAWANPGPEPARLLRLYTPQPRPIGGRGNWGVFDAPDTPVPSTGGGFASATPVSRTSDTSTSPIWRPQARSQCPATTVPTSRTYRSG